MKSTNMTRRTLLGTVSALAAAANLAKPANVAAEFDFKLGVTSPKPTP